MTVDATGVEDLPCQLIPETHWKAQDMDVPVVPNDMGITDTLPVPVPDLREKQHCCPQQHLQGNYRSYT
eukprot:1544229-Rhodomonas_salina.1